MYTVREAAPHELNDLAAVERAAAQLFRSSPYPELADGPLAADSLLTGDRVWVVVATDVIVGFAILRSSGRAIHIQEIDVHPDHSRRGLGARLIDAIVAWAQGSGYSAVTLTTFSDVPWNGPYYARLGFELVEGRAITDELRRILKSEEAAGIKMDKRICMRRILSRP